MVRPGAYTFTAVEVDLSCLSDGIGRPARGKIGHGLLRIPLHIFSVFFFKCSGLTGGRLIVNSESTGEGFGRMTGSSASIS